MRHICDSCGHTEERDVSRGMTARRYRHKRCPERPGWMEPRPMGRPRLKVPTITRGVALTAADWVYARSLGDGDGYASGLRKALARLRELAKGGADK